MSEKGVPAEPLKRYEKPELTKYSPLREITAVGPKCNPPCTTISSNPAASC